MPTIQFPNVPNVPGVPQIPRSVNFTPSPNFAVGLLEGVIWRSLQIERQWGIWDADGKSLGDPSIITGIGGDVLEALGIGSTLSTDSVDYSKEMRTSDFPVERGGFASYNKVELPAEPTVILALSGYEGQRTTFLNAIDAATKSTATYNVVTPEVVYVGYTLGRYNYHRRSSQGVTLLLVEISLKEVRNVSAAYSQVTTQIESPKDAGATPQVDNGKVQARAADQSVITKAANYLGGLF